MTRHGLATPFSESLMLSVTMSLALVTPPIASVTISSPGLGQHSRCKPPAKATLRIPIEAGQGFRREAGHYSGLKPATSPM